MIALNNDGARFAFVGINRDRSETFNFFIVDNLFVIQDDGHAVSD
ncbi:MAG: hypothetical protein WKF37_02540 [Bryobacteraceae bacterium]